MGLPTAVERYLAAHLAAVDGGTHTDIGEGPRHGVQAARIEGHGGEVVTRVEPGRIGKGSDASVPIATEFDIPLHRSEDTFAKGLTATEAREVEALEIDGVVIVAGKVDFPAGEGQILHTDGDAAGLGRPLLAGSNQLHDSPTLSLLGRRSENGDFGGNGFGGVHVEERDILVGGVDEEEAEGFGVKVAVSTPGVDVVRARYHGR